jgi:hypothetical protein
MCEAIELTSLGWVPSRTLRPWVEGHATGEPLPADYPWWQVQDFAGDFRKEKYEYQGREWAEGPCRTGPPRSQKESADQPSRNPNYSSRYYRYSRRLLGPHFAPHRPVRRTNEHGYAMPHSYGTPEGQAGYHLAPERHHAARDLQPARPGETRPRTSHRDIASKNSRKLQQLGTQVTINVDTAITPQRLQHAAGAAARSGDLQTQLSVPGHAMHAMVRAAQASPDSVGFG